MTWIFFNVFQVSTTNCLDKLFWSFSQAKRDLIQIDMSTASVVVNFNKIQTTKILGVMMLSERD